MSSQVRVQVGVGVGYPIQLELGLDLQNRKNTELVSMGASGRVCVGVCGVCEEG